MPVHSVGAQDPDLAPNPHHEAARIVAAEQAMSQAESDLQSLGAQQPAGLLDGVRRTMALDRAAFAFRAAARQEELRLYELAGYASVEQAVVPLLPSKMQGPFMDTIAALHSLYILSGICLLYTSPSPRDS